MSDKSVDIVIEYVDNRDPVWQNEYNKYQSGSHERRYRSWDNLQYLFRGIEKHMKFIRTVHFVVSNIEQIPSWLNKDKVHIVLHKDIIPQEYLPTFNSTTIEMCIPRIQGLSEKFILFNDDMFPNAQMSEDDFFDKESGYPIYQLINRTHAQNTFRMQCRNSYRLAKEMSQEYTGNANRNAYFYIKHSADPMLRSVCLELWDKASDRILDSMTKFREPFNFTQYLFPDYSIMTGRWREGCFDFSYYTAAFLQMAMDDIEKGIHKMICVNDSKGVDFEYDKACVINAFQKRYPEKCWFEL